MQVHLTTLNGVSVQDAHGRPLPSVLAQSKRLALLIYLAAAGGRARRRDVVISLFWPELDDEHARGALRQALTYLRRALGDGVILSRAEDLWIDPARIELDSLKFEQACSQGSVEEAITFYKSDFLEGFFVTDGAPELERWVDDERARLRRLAHKACSEIARAKEALGLRTEAVSWARRATALAPNDEAELRRLILLLADLGDRAGAVEAYDAFARRLAADFEVEPAAETQALIQRVRTQTATVGITHGAQDNAAKVPAIPAVPSPRVTPVSIRRRPAAVTYLIIIGLLAFAGYIAVFFAGRQTGATDNLRIVVLPIAVLDGDTAQSYLADGLTEQLITELAQLPGIEVINRRTMMEFRSARARVTDIMRTLNADAVLTASIQRLADTTHMTAQLVLAGDEKAIWARSFDGSRADLLRLQQRIALSAARSLGVDVERDPGTGSARDPAALDRYIRARYAWNQRGQGPLLKSIDLFRQALDIDPTFALAYSGMGDAYVQLGYGSYLRPDDAFLKARAAAERALDLDSTLAEPHATLAFVALYYDWNWDTARQEFERALARNPSYATAHEWAGLFEAAMGRFDDAIKHERRAQELDPLSVPIAGTAGWVLFYSDRLNDAERELQIVLRQNSAFPLGHLYLGRVFEARGQLDSALAQYAATGALREWVPTIAARAYAFGRQQNQEQARAELAHLNNLAQTQYVTAYAVALVHTALAQPDSAFAWLDRAVAERTHWLVWLNRDRRWAPLRSDPRFAKLVQRVGLPR